jgi:hypothetical protein
VRLRIDPVTTALAPGDSVSGDVVVLAGGPARAVEARLEFVEHVAKLSRTAHVVCPTTIGGGDLASGDVLRFDLPLPEHAPPSLTTDVGRLDWDLVVRVDRPRRRDLEERLTLLVELRAGP